MNMLNCEWLQQQNILNCTPVKTTAGEQGICVQTSYRWLDGSLLTFYLSPQANQILISDECNTLFQFKIMGLLESKRSWKTLREKLNCTASHIQLLDDGEIICLTTREKAKFAIADYLSALCALMHYERELIGIPQPIIEFSQEVEFYLKAWKPKAELIKQPQIQGISGHEYAFDFQLDNQLVLAIKPTPNAVGATMRKVGDVISGSYLGDRQILIIVDDRSDDLFKQKADEEIRIIATLAKAVPFTQLIKVAEKSYQTH